MSSAGHGYGGLEGDEPLPAILERAQQDRLWQMALAKLGYHHVKIAFNRQLRDQPRSEIFLGAKHLNHYPPMDFVRGWLKAQRMRTLRRLRWTFLGAMAATIVAVATFAISCQCITVP
jgi:hypothetical protein